MDAASLKNSTLAPAYAGVSGGYTQIFKMGPRRGDGAEMAIVRMIDYVKVETDEKATKKSSKKAAKAAETQD